MKVSKRNRGSYKKDRDRNYKFEEIENFKYFGTMINNWNGRNDELKQRIQVEYAAY